jgi:hypothetical protein
MEALSIVCMVLLRKHFENVHLEEKDGEDNVKLNLRREAVGREGVKNWVRSASRGWLWH